MGEVQGPVDWELLGELFLAGIPILDFRLLFSIHAAARGLISSGKRRPAGGRMKSGPHMRLAASYDEPTL